MLELVAQHKGAHPIAASLLRFHQHPGVVFVPLSDLPPVDVALLWLSDTPNTDVEAFADAVVRHARKTTSAPHWPRSEQIRR
jgi:hypothetical protein